MVAEFTLAWAMGVKTRVVLPTDYVESHVAKCVFL